MVRDHSTAYVRHQGLRHAAGRAALSGEGPKTRELQGRINSHTIRAYD